MDTDKNSSTQNPTENNPMGPSAAAGSGGIYPDPAVSPASIYPVTSENQNLGDPVLKTPSRNPARSPRKAVTGIFIILLVLVAIIATDPNLKAKLLPPRNTATAANDFQRYTLAENPILQIKTPSISFMFYKNSTIEQMNGGDSGAVVSPGLAGGRLPLEVSIADIRALKIGGLKPFQARSCTALNGPLAYTVSIPSLNDEKANICSITAVKGGGWATYDAEFSDVSNMYELQIAVKGSMNSPATKYNLNFYTSDIKYIIGSIKIVPNT